MDLKIWSKTFTITTLAEAWCKAMGITAHQHPVVSHHARAAVDVRPAVAEPMQPSLLTWDVLLARGATNSRCVAVSEELIAFAAAKHTSLSCLHMRLSGYLLKTARAAVLPPTLTC